MCSRRIIPLASLLTLLVYTGIQSWPADFFLSGHPGVAENPPQVSAQGYPGPTSTSEPGSYPPPAPPTLSATPMPVPSPTATASATASIHLRPTPSQTETTSPQTRQRLTPTPTTIPTRPPTPTGPPTLQPQPTATRLAAERPAPAPTPGAAPAQMLPPPAAIPATPRRTLVTQPVTPEATAPAALARIPQLPTEALSPAERPLNEMLPPVAEDRPQPSTEEAILLALILGFIAWGVWLRWLASRN